MKKSILTLVAALSIGTLVAQSTSPTTNPPSGTQEKKKEMPGTQGTEEMQTKQTPQQSNTAKSATQVPGTVSSRFSTDYPNTNTTWTMSGKNYRAEYMDPKTNSGRAVVYDQNGNPLGMEREVSRTDLPPTINEYYTATYPNEEYRVWTNDDKTGKKSYYITRKSEVLWFDDKGAFIRKEAHNQEMSR
jgi:hypothetical protein